MVRGRLVIAAALLAIAVSPDTRAQREAVVIVADRAIAAVAFGSAELQRAFAAAMASDLGRGRENPQVFEGQLKMRSIVEPHLEQPRSGAQLDVGGLRRGRRAHRIYRDKS